jgi:phosphate transport system ATP-binding protein
MKEKINVKNFSVFNGRTCLLQRVNLSVYEHEILSVIGPAHSGKSTFIRSLNRMIGIKIPVRIEGEITLDGKNIFDPMC